MANNKKLNKQRQCVYIKQSTLDKLMFLASKNECSYGEVIDDKLKNVRIEK